MAHARRPLLRPLVRAGGRVRLPRAALGALRRERVRGHLAPPRCCDLSRARDRDFALALVGAAAYRRRARTLEASPSRSPGRRCRCRFSPSGSSWRDRMHAETALVTLAVVYAFSAAAPSSVRASATSPSCSCALGLFAAALATATFLSNGGLSLPGHSRESRCSRVARPPRPLELPACRLAYLAAAAVTVLVVETPLRHLFAEQAHPATASRPAHLLWRRRCGRSAPARPELLADRLDLAAAGACCAARRLCRVARFFSICRSGSAAATSTRSSSAARRWCPRSGRSSPSRCLRRASRAG